MATALIILFTIAAVFVSQRARQTREPRLQRVSLLLSVGALAAAAWLVVRTMLDHRG